MPMLSDRRVVLKMMTGAGAVVISNSAVAAPPNPIKGMTVINTLGGLSNYNAQGRSGRAGQFLRLDPRVIADAKASGLTAMNLTIGYTGGPGDPFEVTVNDLAAADEVIRTNPDLLVKVYRAADIDRAKAQGKIGAIYGVQNCAMLGDKASRADLFADLGLRIFQLTYNEENRLGGGARAETKELTPFGREVIERVNARKAIVDLSHGGHRTAMDAAVASKQPACITHTACRALKDTPRNATDELLRAVSSRGGYVGIVFGGMFLTNNAEASADDVVAHVDHAIQICGEDHVGIGTDNPITGIDNVAAWKETWARAAQQRAASGIGAAGETTGLPFTQDLLGPDQFRTLHLRMRQKGYSTARIEKVLGRNFLNYARTVWGG